MGAVSREPVAPLTRTSYWLLPVAGDGARFSGLINRLAGLFGGPVFAPHLTVYSGSATRTDPALILAAAVVPDGELVLRCTDLQFSEQYTKACVINFGPEAWLNRLSDSIRQNSGQADNYLLAPHLSLFYGKLTRAERLRIRELISLPATVRFGGLAALATSEVIRSREDVRSWRQLAEVRM